jgi:hypothetical protein
MVIVAGLGSRRRKGKVESDARARSERVAVLTDDNLAEEVAAEVAVAVIVEK